MTQQFWAYIWKVKSESEVTQACLLFATPWTAAFRAPPSMGFSRQEYWSGVPLSSPSFFAVRTCKIYSLGKFQV